MKTIYLYIGGAVLVLILGSLGVYSLTRTTESPLVSDATTTPQFATSTEPEKPHYTIEQVPMTTSIRDIMPSLTKSIVYGTGFPESARKYYEKKITDTRARLDADPTRADDWYDLAIWYHSVNDFKAAEEVWLFLEKVNPKDSTAIDNLGKLYHYSIKDLPKSESYFKKSISLNPESLISYIELFHLYADNYKTPADAIAILETAAKKFPTETDPLTILGMYYRDRGEMAKARDAYMRALDRARTANNVPLMNAIGEELESLPQ